MEKLLLTEKEKASLALTLFNDIMEKKTEIVQLKNDGNYDQANFIYENIKNSLSIIEKLGMQNSFSYHEDIKQGCNNWEEESKLLISKDFKLTSVDKENLADIFLLALPLLEGQLNNLNLFDKDDKEEYYKTLKSINTYINLAKKLNLEDLLNKEFQYYKELSDVE